MALVFTQKQPTFLEQMLSSGIQGFQQSRAQTQAAEQQSAQSSALADLLGIPEEQKAAFAAAGPQGQQAFLQSAGAQAKEGRLGERQSALQGLLGISPAAELQQDAFAARQEIPGLEGIQADIPSQTPPPPQQEQQRRFSQEQVNAATLLDPNVGRVMQAQNDASDKQIERKAALHNKANEKYFERITEKSEALPRKQSALDAMANALEGSDLGFFSKDNLAELSGIEGLRTAKGAEFISAGKDFFMGALRDSGGRPNQFLEKKVSEMLPKVGRSKEANETVVELLRTENAIQEKQIELSFDLANELEASLGYVPRDLSRRVAQQLKPFAKHQEELLEERVREITGEVKLRKVEAGTPLSDGAKLKIFKQAGNDPAKALKIAKGLGYDL